MVVRSRREEFCHLGGMEGVKHFFLSFFSFFPKRKSKEKKKERNDKMKITRWRGC